MVVRSGLNGRRSGWRRMRSSGWNLNGGGRFLIVIGFSRRWCSIIGKVGSRREGMSISSRSSE